MVLSQYKFRSIAAQKVHPKSIPRGGMDAADKLRYRDVPSNAQKIFSPCAIHGSSLKSETSLAREQLPMTQNLKF